VAPPPRLRRRPALVAAAVGAVCLGAVIGVLALQATSTTNDVVAVRAAVARGELLERDDLLRVQVGTDPALSTVPGDRLASLVGQRAAADMPAGSLVTPDSTADKVVPPQGQSVVGIPVPTAALPGEPLQPGDPVRIVATPTDGDPAAATSPAATTAEVVGVRVDPETGETVVSVQVPFEQAAALAAQAARGVAVVLDSREK
jgi:hypothetical protein